MNEKNVRIVAVANEKGGVGKTATVVNLGAALSMENKKVLIVDMDPQGNATSGLGVEVNDDNISTYDLLVNSKKISPENAILPSGWTGLDVIPSHADLAGAEIELIREIGRENKLRKALSGISDMYDVILLDTPPSLSILTVNVFAYATEILVPCQTQPYAYAALDDLFETIDVIREDINPGLEFSGIVATFFDQRTAVSRDILSKLKQDDRCNGFVFDTVVRSNTTIAASTDVGEPVVFFKKSSYGARDYMSLAKEFVAKQG